MYRKLVLFGLMFILMSACKPSTSAGISTTELASLHTELMALHDSTMVKHGVSLKMIDQLDQIKLSQPEGSLDSIRDELDRSNEAMMDWMAEYTDPVTQDSSALNYLMDQLRLMKAIAQTQATAISGGKTILETKK